MDEYGEALTIRVWPLHQKIGEPLPEDFIDKLRGVLSDAEMDFWLL